jgi:hypothetical protein
LWLSYHQSGSYDKAVYINIWFDYAMPNTNLGTAIGKIVKSNTHVDYVCQVYGPNEVADGPQPSDYCFGGFVTIQLDDNGAAQPDSGAGRGEQLIGVIYNTLLLNPDFGNLGPRLSPREDVAVFTPDYLAETATLVGVLALGWVDGNHRPHQGVPSLAATANSAVYRLTDEALRRFHEDDAGRLALRYAPLLLAQNNSLTMPLLINIVDRLGDFFPDQRGQLKLMRNNLAWKSVVRPAG